MGEVVTFKSKKELEKPVLKSLDDVVKEDHVWCCTCGDQLFFITPLGFECFTCGFVHTNIGDGFCD
jgi:hypothetical protein